MASLNHAPGNAQGRLGDSTGTAFGPPRDVPSFLPIARRAAPATTSNRALICLAMFNQWCPGEGRRSSSEFRDLLCGAGG